MVKLLRSSSVSLNVSTVYLFSNFVSQVPYNDFLPKTVLKKLFSVDWYVQHPDLLMVSHSFEGKQATPASCWCCFKVNAPEQGAHLTSSGLSLLFDWWVKWMCQSLALFFFFLTSIWLVAVLGLLSCSWKTSPKIIWHVSVAVNHCICSSFEWRRGVILAQQSPAAILWCSHVKFPSFFQRTATSFW